MNLIFSILGLVLIIVFLPKTINDFGGHISWKLPFVFGEITKKDPKKSDFESVVPKVSIQNSNLTNSKVFVDSPVTINHYEKPDRSLNDPEHLTELNSVLPTEKIPLRMAFQAGDMEAMKFSDEIKIYLVKQGWQISSFPFPLGGNYKLGIYMESFPPGSGLNLLMIGPARR